VTEGFREQRDAVFDDAFVAAAPVREPSAEARALLRHRLPDQRTGDETFEALSVTLPPRWTVRPSHRLAALRPIPTALVAVSVLAAVAIVVMLLR
jgi:hypothetical protein